MFLVFLTGTIFVVFYAPTVEVLFVGLVGDIPDRITYVSFAHISYSVVYHGALSRA